MVEKRSNFLWGIVFFSLVVASTAEGMIYVDATATAGAKDGTSWGDAYIHLQDALAEAIGGPDDIRVTVSVGATFIRKDDTEASVVKRVDGLMYSSKQGGRNRVTFG